MISVFNKIFDRFRQDQNGSVALIWGIVVIPLMLLAGYALDYTRASLVKQRLNQAIDSAALAVGSWGNLTPAQMGVKIQQYIDANYPVSEIGTITSITPVIAGNTITVTAVGFVPTTLLNIMGRDRFNITAVTEVTRNIGKIEVALVLDNTGSMCNPCSKIQALRDSANLLVDTVFGGQSNDPDIRIGLVPFARFVNVGLVNDGASWLMPNTNPPAWNGCVLPRNQPDDVNDAPAVGASRIPRHYGSQCSMQPFLDLTSTKATITNEINAMSTGGWTYIPAGLAWGWRMVSPNLPFTNVAPYNDPEWKKAIVLMTDGANTVYFQNGVPMGGPEKGDADQRTAAVCSNVKAQNIKLYTVAFQVSDPTTISLLQTCATTPADFFDASNSTALQAAFAAIANDITDLRLSK